jgi:L-ascorbate metabolism protein UlaG (beta-lactamase superfamily)
VGWLLSFDGIVLYHAGDTSYLPEMDAWKAYGIDYALLPCDGFYNMGPEEASRCATAMGAKAVIPIHSSKSELHDAKNARAVVGERVVLLSPGESTKL